MRCAWKGVSCQRSSHQKTSIVVESKYVVQSEKLYLQQKHHSYQYCKQQKISNSYYIKVRSYETLICVRRYNKNEGNSEKKNFPSYLFHSIPSIFHTFQRTKCKYQYYSILKPSMKQTSELQRVNYSLQKHHRQVLHQQINPRIIEKLEVADNPSLNYRKAFESVYHDEVERTMQYQLQKNSNSRVKLPAISHSSSHQSLGAKYRPVFTDYDQERTKKFDDLINKGLDGGKSFFRAQEEYQKRKEFEKSITSNTLKQQLVINRQQKTLSKQKENQENELIQQNRVRMLDIERARQQQRKQEQRNLGLEIQQQMQGQAARRAQQRNRMEAQQLGRHNPITNPIEYHIDNPYILKKYQDRIIK